MATNVQLSWGTFVCVCAFARAGSWLLREGFLSLQGVGASRCSALLQSTGSDVGINSCGSQVSCSGACGILPEQGLNLCLLYWQVDPQSLDHHQAHTF